MIHLTFITDGRMLVLLVARLQAAAKLVYLEVDAKERGVDACDGGADGPRQSHAARCHSRAHRPRRSQTCLADHR